MIYHSLPILLLLLLLGLTNSDSIKWNRPQSVTDPDEFQYTKLVFDIDYDHTITTQQLQQLQESPWFIWVTYTDGVANKIQFDHENITITNKITIDVGQLIKTLKLSPLFDGVIQLNIGYAVSGPVRITKGAVLCKPSPIIIWNRNKSQKNVQGNEYVTLVMDVIYDNMNDGVIEWIYDIQNWLNYRTIQHVDEAEDGRFTENINRDWTLNVNKLNDDEGDFSEIFQFGFKTEHGRVFMSSPVQFNKGHVLCETNPVITLNNEMSTRVDGHYTELSFEINYDGMVQHHFDFNFIIVDETNGQKKSVPHQVDINRPNFVNIALDEFKRSKLSGTISLELKATHTGTTVHSDPVVFLKGIVGGKDNDSTPTKILAVLLFGCISIGGLLVAVIEIPSTKKHDKEFIEVNL